jgi:hypothetical protein
VGELVAELSRFRVDVRERRRTAETTRPHPASPVGLHPDHMPLADLLTTIPTTPASRTAAQSEPPAARLGARRPSLPKEI